MPKKKRVSRRAKRGVYISLKTRQACAYRSGWELLYLQYLDVTPEIIDYRYEPFSIPYLSNIKTQKIRQYYPDFYLEYSDGRKVIVEIKPLKRIHNMKNHKKFSAINDWCRENNHTFEIVTEVELKALGIMK